MLLTIKRVLIALILMVSFVCSQEFSPALQQKAEAGDTSAQYMLGKCLHFGHGTSKNPTEAFKWLKIASEHGHIQAQGMLGLSYITGSGTEPNPEIGVTWLRKSADGGNATSQSGLGLCYKIGVGVKSDLSQAAFWYRKAAEQGDAVSQYELSILYATGLGVEKNSAEALKWLQKAAEQGNGNAQLDLGISFNNGEGVTKNPAKAAILYQKAARQGVSDAQNNLALLYLYGEGVIKDEIEGMAWLYLSSAGGSELGKAKLPLWEKKLGMKVALTGRERAKEIQREFSNKETKPSDSFTTPKSSGSGAFVSSNGIIATAAHVVEGATSLKVVTSQGTKEAKIVKIDTANDVAFLKVEGTYPFLPVVSSRAIPLGRTVFTIGFPNTGLQGFSPKFTKGEISSLNGIQDDPRHWQISVPVQPGNSGGALVDENGNWVGIVVAKLNEIKAAKITGNLTQNVNYALKSDYSRPLLEDLGIEFVKANPDAKAQKLEELAAKVEPSIVLILVY